VANSWFTAYGLPQTRGVLSSAEIRREFSRIEAAFAKMPEPAAGVVRGFDSPYIQSPTVENGAWLGGTLGSEALPAQAWTSRAYVGLGVGGLVSDVLLNSDKAGAFFRIASTDRIGFGKKIDGTTPKVSFFMDEKASLVMGDATAEAATTTTTGFFYLPTVNGAPTGSATAYTGAVPAVVDRANNRLYIRVATTWRYVALT